MRRWARAGPIILIGVLAAALLAIATESVPAEAGAARLARASVAKSTRSDITIAPEGSGGNRLDVTVDPGASVQRSFVVANRSRDLRLTVRLAGVDASAQSRSDVKYATDASADPVVGSHSRTS